MIWLEKLANYAMDVSKYLITGVIVTTMFSDFKGNIGLLYAISGGLATILLLASVYVYLYIERKKKNKENNKHEKEE